MIAKNGRHFSPKSVHPPYEFSNSNQRFSLNENLDFYDEQTFNTQEVFYRVPQTPPYSARTPSTPAFNFNIRSPRNRHRQRFPRSQPNSPRFKVEQFYIDSKNQATDKEIDFFINDNSEEAMKASAHIMFNEPIETDDPEVIKLAIIDLQHKRDYYNQSGQFKEAESAEIALGKARELMLDAMKTRAQDYEMNVLNIRSGHMTTDYIIHSHFNKAKEEELDTKLEKSMQNLLKRQEQEIIQHQKEWDSEQKKRLYNKTSPKLHELRNQQNRLIKAKKFEEAEEFGKKADELFQEELMINMKRHIAAFNDSKKALLKKHEEERKLLMEKNSLKKTIFKHKVQAENDKLKKKKRVLNIQKAAASDKEALWRHKRDHIAEYNSIPKDSGREMDFKVDNPVSLGLPSLGDSIRRIKK